MEIKLDADKAQSILFFIEESVCELRHLNIQKECIKILIPEPLVEMIFYRLREEYSFSPTNKVENLKELKIFDIQIYPHYKNEIVVYNAKFNFSNHPNQHKILLL